MFVRPLAQSPFEIPDAFACDGTWPDGSARAREAIAWLGGTDGTGQRGQKSPIRAGNCRPCCASWGRMPPPFFCGPPTGGGCNLHVLLPDFELPPACGEGVP
jgi:hypothetical protein